MSLTPPNGRIPIGSLAPDGSVSLHPEWARFLSQQIVREIRVIAGPTPGEGDWLTLPQVITLLDAASQAPLPSEHVQSQDDAPSPDVHVQTIDDAPGDVAVLREELVALRDRVAALELK
jgi:hypothetical protein